MRLIARLFILTIIWNTAGLIILHISGPSALYFLLVVGIVAMVSLWAALEWERQTEENNYPARQWAKKENHHPLRRKENGNDGT